MVHSAKSCALPHRYAESLWDLVHLKAKTTMPNEQRNNNLATKQLQQQCHRLTAYSGSASR